MNSMVAATVTVEQTTVCSPELTSELTNPNEYQNEPKRIKLFPFQDNVFANSATGDADSPANAAAAETSGQTTPPSAICESLAKTTHAQIGDFDVLKYVNEGTYGQIFKVCKVNGSDEGQIYAMKVLQKSSYFRHGIMRTEKVFTERNIMAKVKHPFVTDLKYAFESETKLYFVMDYLSGRDLFYQLASAKYLEESTAKFYLAEVLLALEYLHSIGIIYRDLKPENVLLDAEGHVSLADFGMSKDGMNFAAGDLAYSMAGTLEYIAPEVLKNEGHGKYADWWSFGIFMHDLLFGFVPFTAEIRKDTIWKILKAKLVVPEDIKCTEEAKDLMRKLLRRNPHKRLGFGSADASPIKQHAFFDSCDWELIESKSAQPPVRPSGENCIAVASGAVTAVVNQEFGEEKTPKAWPRDAFKGFGFTASDLQLAK